MEAKSKSCVLAECTILLIYNIVNVFKYTKRFRGPMVRIPPFQGGGSCSIHGGCIQILLSGVVELFPFAVWSRGGCEVVFSPFRAGRAPHHLNCFNRFAVLFLWQFQGRNEMVLKQWLAMS